MDLNINSMELLKIIESPSPLIQLVNEIWGKILKKLTPNEALNLRFVDKDFKTKIDNLYEDWVIHLDENSPYFDKLLDLKVKEVIVKCLSNPLPNRPPGVIFKFPNLLTKITIPTVEISAENLHFLLQSEALKSISMSLGVSALDDLFWETLDPKIGYNFQNLLSLDLTICEFTHLSENNLNKRLMTRSKMPKLKSLLVHWRGDQSLSSVYLYKLTHSLFSCLAQHGHNLKKFIFQNFIKFDRPLDFLEDKSLTSLLRNCFTLENLHISSKTNVLKHSWERLVKNQSKIARMYYQSSSPLSEICAKFCANNFETLTHIKISGLPTERMDLSVFAKSVHLRQLSLHSPRDANDRQMKIDNFSTLPETIAFIQMNSVLIGSEEISKFLKKSHSLISFFMIFIGEKDEHGINFSTLKDILSHTNLKSVSLYRSLNVPSVYSELLEFNKTLSAFGYEVDIYTEYYWRFGLEKKIDSNGDYSWVHRKNQSKQP